MATRECPSCAMDVDKSNSVCPICGYEFPGHPNSRKWIALVLALLFAWPIMMMIWRFINYIF